MSPRGQIQAKKKGPKRPSAARLAVWPQKVRITVLFFPLTGLCLHEKRIKMDIRLSQH